MLSNTDEVGSNNCPALRSLLGFGHFCFKLCANTAFKLGSVSCTELKLWSLPSNEEQCENPSVCPPERATKSFTASPLLAKLWMSWLVLKDGAGKFTVSLALDTLPSFLPFSTFQYGPPDYKIDQTWSIYELMIAV